MAMMMTGRVLLVCALGVLWCGAGGVYARDVDNSAFGGCMASGLLGTNWCHMPSGCKKTEITLPLRSALSITAAEASTDGEEAPVTIRHSPGFNPSSVTPPIKQSESLAPTISSEVPPPPPPPEKESKEPLSSRPPVPGDSDTGGGNSDRDSGAGGTGGVVDGVGGIDGLSEVPSSGVPSSSSSDPNGNDLSKTLSNTPSIQNRESSEKGEPSGKKSPGPVSPSGQTGEVSKPEEKSRASDTQEEGETSVAGKDTTKAEGTQSDMKTDGSSNTLSTAGKSKVQPPPPVKPPTAEELQPNRAPKDPRTATEEKHEMPTSATKTNPDTPKTSLKDGMADRHGHDATTPVLVKNAATGNSAERKSPSISTNDSDDAQSTGDENNDDDPRPKHKETGDHKAANTKFASTPSETAPQTVKTETFTVAQKNDTATSGDSDGSTAVSHTTSPLLLLLVVACAAAAAVVAA
ncbi:Mucin-associated surface protein (MASP) [Trypanosoma cruzi]|uniref:Mucin-associated surface protein (MASP) n=1 Tax=Trypanosoma cruzi TaxID=5693 RepID=A0A2V2WG11_TRYCR|nr:Mucin-associated surface protein (MASP) [Trypanosoma cruzi]